MTYPFDNINNKNKLKLLKLLETHSFSFPKNKTIFTGNPCGEDAVKQKPMDKKELGLTKDKKLVLFVMGSLGSYKVNEFLINTMNLYMT